MKKLKLLILIGIIIIIIAANCQKRNREVFTPEFTISPTNIYVGDEVVIKPLGYGGYSQHTILLEKGAKVAEYNGALDTIMFTVTEAGTVLIKNTVFRTTDDATTAATVIIVHSFPVVRLTAATVIADLPAKIWKLDASGSYNPDASWLDTATVTGFRWYKNSNKIEEGKKIIYLALEDAETATVTVEARDQLETAVSKTVVLTPTGAATTPSLPIVETLDATAVATSSAILRGRVDSSGITRCGFVLSSGATYTAEDVTEDSFSVLATDLIPDTTFSFTAFAVNEKGIGWGEAKTFHTQATTATTATTATSVTARIAVTGTEIPSDESYVKYTLSYAPETPQSTWTELFFFAPDEGATWIEINPTIVAPGEATYIYTGYSPDSGLHESRVRIIVEDEIGNVLGEAATSTLISL